MTMAGTAQGMLVLQELRKHTAWCSTALLCALLQRKRQMYLLFSAMDTDQLDDVA